MIKIVLEHRVLFSIVLVLFIFSLLCQIMTAILYQNMINETKNMSSTEHKILKVCKLKFSNCYELHQGVPNIPVFVEKFLHGIRIGRMSLKSLYHLSGQILLFTIFLIGTGICSAIAKDASIADILPFYIISFIMVYLYFAIAAMLDIKGKRNVLKTNLIDYLENNMSVRILQTKADGSRLDELERVEEKESLSPQEEAEFEMLLRDFLFID